MKYSELDVRNAIPLVEFNVANWFFYGKKSEVRYEMINEAI